MDEVGSSSNILENRLVAHKQVSIFHAFLGLREIGRFVKKIDNAGDHINL